MSIEIKKLCRTRDILKGEIAEANAKLLLIAKNLEDSPQRENEFEEQLKKIYCDLAKYEKKILKLRNNFRSIGFEL